MFSLDKSVWTQDDYEQMGWHDCSIYGLAFLPFDEENHTTNLLFDIDYIFNWVKPVFPQQYFSFWIAPCTLVFKDAFELEININRKLWPSELSEIADLHLVSKTENENNYCIYEWHIELREGYIKFKSSGFEQIVRQKPMLTDIQMLRLDERKGISFNTTPCMI